MSPFSRLLLMNGHSRGTTSLVMRIDCDKEFTIDAKEGQMVQMARIALLVSLSTHPPISI